MSMLYPLSRLIKSIVEEKETRTRETMKIMGLSDTAFVASWFVTYFLIFSLIAYLISFLMVATFIQYSNSFLVFIFIYLFVLSLLPFAFLISVFFDKAKLAAIVGPVILFTAVMPRYAFYTSGSSQALAAKQASCLLAPSAFTFGADILMEYEGAQVGINWGMLFDDELSLATVLGYLVLDFLLYSFLAWYFDQVIPSEYGSKQPWYFLFQKKFWIPNSTKFSFEDAPEFGRRTSNASLVEDRIQTANRRNSIVEAVSSNLKPGVEIINLRKVFTQGWGKFQRKLVAVKRLNLVMYEGQITALLGHNGAGKTTSNP